MTEACAHSDQWQFFRTWLSDPFRVAAIAPSGQSLGRLITSEIDVNHAPVLELGPGTGVFTRALLSRGLRETDLILVEYGTEFSNVLQQRFPNAFILNLDAARLTDCKLPVSSGIGAVVSGLPLLSMSPRKVMSILRGAFSHIRSGGSFYQFTYGPRCPVPRTILDRLGLKATRIGGTVRNLPPASVYRISRRRNVINPLMFTSPV
ncbi:SAM-dependent methyltransferase [Phyllobacterium sp. YR531]|uniref:class I SAM-dependent methyltransferase n=1 Tax=Phyllobacterium sp. YR531 TaxID=1144343 RepID=UPI00026F8737|nr:SAM-dependent methyltransferase [Phyllobacterium sp. YR531]EJN02130.1 phospholipid N-methyltransferase [Phyllobacterium sp. YR531]